MTEIKNDFVEDLFNNFNIGGIPEMTMEETKDFISLHQLNDDKIIDQLYNELRKVSIPINIFIDRLSINKNISFDKKIIIFTGMNIDIPGNMVLFAAYCLYKAKKYNIKGNFSWYDFCKIVIPMGFITKEKFSKIWDLQKTEEGKNIFDNKKAFQSIIEY